MMKSRDKLFIVGLLFSTNWELAAPSAEITTPPKTIPVTRGVCDILAAQEEKKTRQITRTLQ